MFVRRSVVQKLFQDMVDNRGKAVENSRRASEIVAGYVERFAAGDSRFTSKVDAERSAANDIRWIKAVDSNQMYDRFAMRDAAVLSGMLKMVEMDLLTIKPDGDFDDINTPKHVFPLAEPNNPGIVPLTKNKY